jgi:hypothetical protein
MSTGDHAHRGMALFRAVQAALRDSIPNVPRVVSPTAPPQPAALQSARKKSPLPARPLNPNQISAARMLLEGCSITDAAAALGVHRYTITRWKADPRFQSELRRQSSVTTTRHEAQANRAAPRHMAPHGATFLRPPAQNKPNSERRS